MLLMRMPARTSAAMPGRLVRCHDSTIFEVSDGLQEHRETGRVLTCIQSSNSAASLALA